MKFQRLVIEGIMIMIGLLLTVNGENTLSNTIHKARMAMSANSYLDDAISFCNKVKEQEGKEAT